MGLESPVIRRFVIESMQEKELIYDFRYCFPDYPVVQKDTIASVSQAFIPKTEKISEIPKLSDNVFTIFFVCFIVTSRVLSSKARMFLSLPDELFRLKERKSIFNDPVSNELYVKSLLFFQTVIILSMFTYSVFTDNLKNNENFVLSDFYEISGKICLLFILFFVYKRISYYTIGIVFFTKESLTQWLNNFMSLVCILGIAIFVPVLLMFYVEWMYDFSCCFVIFCLLAAVIIAVYRIYILFFHDISKLHYLFLYLCAQELVPLLVLYKGLVCLT